MYFIEWFRVDANLNVSSLIKMIEIIMKWFLQGFVCIRYITQVIAAEIIKDKKHRSHEIIIISEMYLKSQYLSFPFQYRPAKVMLSM